MKTFNFVQELGGNGMEQFKKEETWNRFRENKHEFSKEFINDLINKDLIDTQAKADAKENKLAKKLDIEREIVMAGKDYWERLINEGLNRRIISYQEVDLLKLASRIQVTGKIPSPKQMQWIWKIREKLEKAGVLVD